ncbi:MULTISPECIES: hypothetical protein [unclassified Rhizobium]|uniref:hypothetical protein n=1 Tax=unclassified Rhizobium TaxID=2613769 RepID=UPI00254B3763|nr:hypothetical protein [Rhizobium sp. CNPSo 4062]MDK4701305.1 hypothetical protein [Rhizobium sp. CNPSo 4062]
MRLLAVLILIFLVTSPTLAEQSVTAKVSVCFTPAEQCEGRIVNAIDLTGRRWAHKNDTNAGFQFLLCSRGFQGELAAPLETGILGMQSLPKNFDYS